MTSFLNADCSEVPAQKLHNKDFITKIFSVYLLVANGIVNQCCRNELVKMSVFTLGIGIDKVNMTSIIAVANLNL